MNLKGNCHPNKEKKNYFKGKWWEINILTLLMTYLKLNGNIHLHTIKKKKKA